MTTNERLRELSIALKMTNEDRELLRAQVAELEAQLADARKERDALQGEVAALESAREQDRATLARVEALPEKWADECSDIMGPSAGEQERAEVATLRTCSRELRAALAPQGEREV